jgi:hypothetical protein
MKYRMLFLIGLTLAAPAMVSAEQSSGVHYTGNRLATKICKAVVDDDVPRLRMLLRSYRQTLPHGYMFSVDKTGVARDFSCNNLDLQAFSNLVGSQKVAGYFAGNSANAESQVAASAE